MTTTTAAPIPHISGWHTYDITLKVGRRTWNGTVFAPDDAAAVVRAQGIAADPEWSVSARVVSVTRRA